MHYTKEIKIYSKLKNNFIHITINIYNWSCFLFLSLILIRSTFSRYSLGLRRPPNEITLNQTLLIAHKLHRHVMSLVIQIAIFE